MWTALHLQRLGARVTVVDAYGAGNSRQTSGGETRGARTSYGDRPHGAQWAGWARRAIERWIAWDEEGRDRLLPQLFFQTGDLILREAANRYFTETRRNWDALGTPYEVLGPDEVARRWPWIRYDSLGVALYEPGAGVVRARRAIESVARVFEEEGGTIRIERAAFGARGGRSLRSLQLQSGGTLSAGAFVLACGPWFPKVLPQLMGRRIRTAMGHVFYFAVPPGDTRFSYPHMPSYGVPGCTGWPALPPTTGDSASAPAGARPRIRTSPIAGLRPSTTIARAKSCGAISRTSAKHPSTRPVPATTRAASTATSSSTRTRTSTTSGWPAAAPPRPSSSAPCSATTSPTGCLATTASPTWRTASG